MNLQKTSSRYSVIFWKSWFLGLSAYALVFTREVPTAFAQAPVETDCSTELDQPDTTYLLNTNVPGNCVIAADNIILDGQNLYTISGDVTATTTATVSFTVRDVEVEGNVNNGVDFDGGDIIIENATIGGTVGAVSYYNLGNILITDSSVGAAGWLATSPSVTVGSVTIEDSTVRGDVGAYPGLGVILINIYGTNEDITITDSTVNGFIWNGGEDLGWGDVDIVRSTVSVTEEGYQAILAADCTITDSSFEIDGFDVQCETLTITDNPPELTVTPLSLELDMGDSFNPFGGVEAEDIKDGDISDDIIVIGSVGDEPGIYELIYSITDSGTTLFNSYDSATTTSGPSTASTTRTVTLLEAASSGGESTRVGTRTGTTDSHTTSTPTTGDQTLDETLAELKVVLAQPITTTDPQALKKLMSLLLELVQLLTEVMERR